MTGDLQLTCSDCGQDFTFTAADQAFFRERGYSSPKRCKACRQAKRTEFLIKHNELTSSSDERMASRSPAQASVISNAAQFSRRQGWLYSRNVSV